MNWFRRRHFPPHLWVQSCSYICHDPTEAPRLKGGWVGGIDALPISTFVMHFCNSVPLQTTWKKVNLLLLRLYVMRAFDNMHFFPYHNPRNKGRKSCLHVWHSKQCTLYRGRRLVRLRKGPKKGFVLTDKRVKRWPVSTKIWFLLTDMHHQTKLFQVNTHCYCYAVVFVVVVVVCSGYGNGGVLA